METNKELQVIESHRVSFSWDIHYKCNYRCPYCWWDRRWYELSKLNRYLSVEEWIKCWQNIYSKYGSANIEMLGGEPFIYPNFTKLLKELSNMHNIRITTNLSTDIEDFITEIDSRNIKISPTFHPLFADLDSFGKKVLLLKEHGFTENILYLAYPPQIRQIPYYKERFNQIGSSLSVMTFWGEYNGIKYPDGYTEKEKVIMGGHLGKRSGEEFQLAPKRMPVNRLCRAGQRYAVIQADGNVIRCGGSGLNEPVGNFFDENFRLLKEPMLCKAEYCKCNEWSFLAVESEHSENKDNPDIFLNNKEKNMQEIAACKVVLESKPLRLGVIVTDWCNLNCIMCPDSRHKHKLTLSESILSKINELLPYLERIEWQGGEFFGFKHVKNIFLSLEKYQRIHNSIITNGLLLDNEWIKLLLRINVELTFSIDSPIKETYEHIRQGARFDRLTEVLNSIIELERKYDKKLGRSITVTVMKSNYQELQDFIPFIKKYGFRSINFNPVMHINNEENIFKDVNLDRQYLDKVMHYLKNKCAEENIRFGWHLPVTATCCKSDDKQKASSKVNAVPLYCNLPWKSLWICASREGNIYSDCWCSQPIGNIFQNTLLEVWNNEKMQEYRKKIITRDFSCCNKDCLIGYSASINIKTY